MKILFGGSGKMAKKIIIIGGGVAGLSAGIYGALEGYDCTILEAIHALAAILRGGTETATT